MKMSYNKLWKLLIDKQMKKSDLQEKSRNQLFFTRQAHQRRECNHRGSFKNRQELKRCC